MARTSCLEDNLVNNEKVLSEKASPSAPNLKDIAKDEEFASHLEDNLVNNEKVLSEKSSPSAPMLKDITKDEKLVIIAPANGGVGRVLVREDTILTNLNGCTSCARGHIFTCSGVQKQCSVLCWGKQSEKKYYCLLVLISTTFVLSMIGTVFFCFTNTIHDVILSNMVIRNNSLAFKIWRRPNVQPLMKVHLFNYTNVDRVKYGYDKKLHVEEVGPYVYSQQVERVNINFEGDKLSYQERNHFRYLPDKSDGAHFDKIIVPNLPLLGVVSRAMSSNLNSLAQGTLSMLLYGADHPNAFLELPVHRFLWGYEDNIINTAKLGVNFKFDKFGLLVTKNGTVSERYTINTGEEDKDKMNVIEEVDGQDHLTFWGSSDCNSIEASDGTIFPTTLLDKKKILHVFNANLCRRLPFHYEKDVEIADGIQLYRYRMPLNVFDDAKNNPENQCYCEIDTATCPPRGVINVTMCSMGAPVLISFPHFYLGDPKLSKAITGLKPDHLKHDSFIDIHPTLGIALSGKSNLQINIQVRKSPMFTNLGFLEEGVILPVAWIEMALEELPEDLRTLIYHGTYSTAAAQLGLIVLCTISFIGSGLCLLWALVRRRQRPCVTLKISKKKTGETELKSLRS